MTDEKLPWFRMYSEIINDDRIELLAFEDQRHYVWLLCLKNEGLLDKDYGDDKLRERIIARKLGLDIEKLRDLKARLSDMGVIDENWQPKGWEKRQYISDTSTARVRRYRERQSKRDAEQGEQPEIAEESNTNNDETFQKRFSNGDVTAPDNRIQKYPNTIVFGAQAPAQAVDNSKPEGGDPEVPEGPQIWDVWLGIAGVSPNERAARSHLGRLIKLYGEYPVARAVAETALKKPADPHAFLEQLLKQNPNGKREGWQTIPPNNDDVLPWACEHDFSKPRAGEAWPAYRARLKTEIQNRAERARGQSP